MYWIRCAVIIFTTALVAALTACGAQPLNTSSEDVRLRFEQLDARERVLDERESVLQQRQQLLAKFELQQSNLAANPLQYASNNPRLPREEGLSLPLNASGRCFQLVAQPPVWQPKERELIIAQAADQIRITPAQWSTQQQTVVVGYRPLTEGENVPMRREQVAVELSPAYTTWQVKAAQFETQTAEYESQPSYQTIDRCQTANGLADVWCPRQVAAVAHSYQRKVLLSLSQATPVEVPAEIRIIDRQVPVNPSDKNRLQALTEVLLVKQLLSPAKAQREVLPAESQTVQVNALAQPVVVAWKVIACPN